MSAGDLWQTFEARLRSSGASLEDLDGCAPQLLQSVLAELGFSALQSVKLQAEWTRRQASRTALGLRHRIEGSSSSSSPVPSRVPLSEGSDEFKSVAAAAQRFLTTTTSPQACSFSILSVERVDGSSDVSDTRPFLPTQSKSRLLWRFVALEDVDRVCREGLDPSWVRDEMCASGLVFFAASEEHPHLQGAQQPHVTPPLSKLLRVEVMYSNAKVLDEEDAGLLGHFSGAKCSQSLREDGFDAITIRRRSPHLPEAIVIFNRDQVRPRHIITFGTVSDALSLQWDGGEATRDSSKTAEAAMSSMQRGLCATHPTKEYEFWCDDEKKLLCSLCLFTGGYDVSRCSLVGEAAVRERPAVERWLSSVDGFVRDSSSVMLAFDNAMEMVESEAQREVSDLRGEVEALKQFLDDLVAAHTQEITARASQQQLALQRTLTQVVAAVSEAEDVAAVAKEGLRAGSSSRAVDVLLARQLASRKWSQVDIPAYFHPSIRFDREAITAFVVDKCELVNRAGAIELPDAVDLNKLMNSS